MSPRPGAALACAGAALAIATIVPASRAQTPLFQVAGDTPGEGFGFAVARAGDVDGDGAGDVVAGALFDVTASVMSGSAWILSGQDGHTIRVWHGVEPRQEFGFAVDGGADVDGDGVADVVVGSPGKDGAAMNTGLVEVLSGTTGAVLRSFTGDDGFDELGFSCAIVGDTDLDGVPDVAGGARWDDDGGTDAGSVRIWSGADGTLLHEIHGTSAFDQLGWDVAGAGDTDGDGRADVIAGAPHHAGPGVDAGRALVISGLDGSRLLTIDGDPGDLLGLSVAGLVAADGSGTSDVVVGRPGSDLAGTDAGRVTVHRGTGGALRLDVTGDAPLAALGFSVSDAGDLDGDGAGDCIAGAPGDVGPAGAAGSLEVFSLTEGTTLAKLHGAATGELFGWSTAGIGDADGDGRSDPVAGSPAAAPGGVPVGSVTATAAAGICPGRSLAYGAALAGSGGIAPRLAAAGCPTPGATVQLTIARGLGAAPAVLLAGVAAASFPLFGGTIGVLPSAILPLQLGGDPGIAGAGSQGLALSLPANPQLTGASLFLQGLVLDPGAPQGLSMTRGLELRLG